VVVFHEVQRLVIGADHGRVAPVLRNLLPKLTHPGIVGIAAKRRIIRVHIDDIDIDRAAFHHVKHAIARPWRVSLRLVITHDEQNVRDGLRSTHKLHGHLLGARGESEVRDEQTDAKHGAYDGNSHEADPSCTVPV